MSGKASPQEYPGKPSASAREPARDAVWRSRQGAGEASAGSEALLVPALAVLSLLAASAWVPGAGDGSGHDAHR
ncbi:MAG: hypothetical protein ACLPUO_23510 [Streptosporangiaceae bacterium]|jgi:hypothetical protein